MSSKNVAPTMIVDESAISAIKSSRKNRSKFICTICQDSILSSENEEINEFDLIRCSEKSNHIFHTKCFVDWFVLEKKCPLCSAYSSEAVLEFCKKAFASIIHSKNPNSNFCALEMIKEEKYENLPVIIEYMNKTRTYDENVELYEKISQYRPTVFLDIFSVIIMLKESIKCDEFLKLSKRELYETLISDQVQNNFFPIILPLNEDFYSILTIDEIMIFLEKFVFNNFNEMEVLGTKVLDFAGILIKKVGKFFDHKNFCKIILKSIEYRCDIPLIDCEITKLFREKFDLLDCNDILKMYLSICHSSDDFITMFSFLNDNSSLKFSEYLKLIELFIYECKDEKGNYNEMNKLCELFLNCFAPNEDAIEPDDAENLAKIFESIRKVPMFTVDLVKMHFERCKIVKDVLNILYCFKVTERRDVNEVLLKSIPNKLLEMQLVCAFVNAMIEIHKIPKSIYADMIFKNVGNFRCSQEYFLKLLEDAKKISVEAVVMVLNLITNDLFKILDANARAVVLREIKYRKCWQILLRFSDQLKDEDLANINKFNIYQALNNYITNYITEGVEIGTLDSYLKNLYKSILLPKYIHIFFKAFADILKYDENDNDSSFHSLIFLFLTSDIFIKRPIKHEMLEKLIYQMINSPNKEYRIFTLYKTGEMALKDKFKLAFIQYFINNRQMIENMDFGDIKHQNITKEKKVEENKLIVADNISDTDNQINIIAQNDHQEQENLSKSLSKFKIKNNSKDDNSVNKENDNTSINDKNESDKENDELKNDLRPINSESKSNLESNEQQISNLKSLISKYSQRMFKLSLASDPQRITKEIENISDKEIFDCIKFILSKKSLNQL